MSEKKTIQFNPELFKVSSNKTRKKRSDTDNSEKIKFKSIRNKMDTLKKRSILRMIREHQEENYKKLLENNEKNNENKEKKYENKFNSDFENSKEFFNKLLE